MSESKISEVYAYFPAEISGALEKMGSGERERITEIRLRVNRPLGVVINNTEKYLTLNGGLTTSTNLSYKITPEILDYCLKTCTEYSVHSYAKELAQGYITLNGGNRVGLTGSFSGENIKYITSMNFRIAGEIIGCGEKILSYVHDFPKNILIAGKPASGKTTVLRDICRIVGNSRRVSLVDERNEISACNRGIPQNNIGLRTDVLESISKAKGINLALRVMSPEIIICDEIGLEDDIKAIASSVNSGVHFIVTIHADSKTDIYSNEHIKPVFHIFDYLIILKEPGKIGDVLKLK